MIALGVAGTMAMVLSIAGAIFTLMGDEDNGVPLMGTAGIIFAGILVVIGVGRSLGLDLEKDTITIKCELNEYVVDETFELSEDITVIADNYVCEVE